MGNIIGSVAVSGFVAPSSDLDTYPSHWAKYGKGGHRSVQDMSELNDIPADRIEEGMTVYVIDEAKTYAYINSAFDIATSTASEGAGGISDTFVTVADMNADSEDRVDGEQAFVEEDTTVYAYDKELDQWTPFMVLDYYDKAESDAMMLSAAIGLKYSLRDMPLGDDAETQMNSIIGDSEGELVILNDNAIWRWTKTSTDPDPETFEWQSFVVLGSGHTHDYELLDNLPNLTLEMVKDLYGVQPVADEASIPLAEGLYYSELEGTFWESDGITSVPKTDWTLDSNVSMSDLVPDMTGGAGKQLVVNDTEDGTIWVTPNTLKFSDIYKKIHEVQYQVAQESDAGSILGMVEGELAYAVAEDAILEYDGTDWAVKTDYELDIRTNLSDMSDVDTTDIQGGSVLKWDAVNSKWVVEVISTKTSDIIKELYTIDYEVADLVELYTISGTEKGELAYREDVDTFYEFDGTDWVARTDFTVDTLGSTYTNATPVPTEIGGVEAGMTFLNVPFAEMLDMLLYPYQYPEFTSFSISGQSTTLEVGDSVTAGIKTFVWATSNSENIEADSLNIVDMTGGSTAIIAGTANDGMEDAAIAEVNKTTATSHTWSASATNTKAETFLRNYTVNWYWAVYYGESALADLTAADIEGLRVKELRSSPNKTYAIAAGNYKWICYPTSMGLKTTFKDVNTNFDVAMDPVRTVSVTNVFGVTQDYYAHRTFNTMGSGINIAVSD